MKRTEKLPRSSSLERKAGAREPPAPLAEELEHVLAGRAVGCLWRERGLSSGRGQCRAAQAGLGLPGAVGAGNPHPAAHREGALNPLWLGVSPSSGPVFCHRLNAPQRVPLPYGVPGSP